MSPVESSISFNFSHLYEILTRNSLQPIILIISANYIMWQKQNNNDLSD